MNSDTAIVHILDREYLEPLKVLRHSMREHNSLPGCDTIVITNDEAVANDDFIVDIADKLVFLDDHALREFSRIRPDRVPKKFEKDFAPKYTFLKLYALRNFGYARHVVMDCDMLCTGQFDEDLLFGEGDVKAVTEYGSNVFPSPRENRAKFSEEKSRQFVSDRASALSIPLSEAGVFNSGFAVLQGKAIDDNLFFRALDLAGESAFSHKQALTTEVLKRQGVSFVRLPIWYNFRRRIYACLGEAYYDETKDSLKILHYTPGKPWKIKDADLRNFDRIWHSSKDRAIASGYIGA